MALFPFSPRVKRADVPDRKQERTFGFVFAAFFLVIAVVPRLQGAPFRTWAGLTAAAFALAAVAFPQLLAGPSRWWLKFGALLHRVTSPVAIAAIYLVGIAPVGVVRRLMGKDPLRLKRDPALDTYWILRSPPGRGDATMKRQF